MFAQWLRATLMRKPEYGIVMPQVDDLQEIRVMLADKLEVWAKAYIEEGKQEGKQEGRQEGEMLVLQRLLARRFGVLNSNVISLISNAPVEDIEIWVDRVLDAETLDDIFK